MMRIVVVFALLICFSTSFFGQEKLTRREQRELAKEIQKKQEAELDEKLRAITKIVIDSAAWVLEADILYNRYGRSINVTSALNFVGIKEGYSTVQLGSETAMGSNGVGGITVEGRVTKYEAEYNEKSQTYYIVINVISAVGNFDIRVNCSANGTWADATIKGNHPYSIKYSGKLIAIALSSVYKGTPIF